MHLYIQHQLAGARVVGVRGPAGGPARWRRDSSLNAVRWLAGTRRPGRLLVRLATTRRAAAASPPAAAACPAGSKSARQPPPPRWNPRRTRRRPGRT